MNSNQFVENIADFCRKEELLPKDDNLVVAVSGGADSVALLFVLLELTEKDRLSVAHFNHGWRPEEGLADEHFVRNLCADLNLKFIVGRSTEPQPGSETKAREQRYAFLYEAAQGAPIALGQHADDQAETMLLNLCRGTGSRGLAAMRPKSGQLIRPFLHTRRAEIEQYLRSLNQPWREDFTNTEAITWRNQLRRQVFPILEKIWSDGNLVGRLLNTADFLAADDAYLTERVQDWIDDFARMDYFIPAELRHTAAGMQLRATSKSEKKLCGVHFPSDQLAKLPRALMGRLIPQIIYRLTGKQQDITARHIERAQEFIEQEKERRTDLIYDVFLQRQGNDLAFLSAPPQTLGLAYLSSWEADLKETVFAVAGTDFRLELSGPVTSATDAPGLIENDMDLVYNISLWIGASQSLTLRTRRPGDWHRLAANRPKRKLKQTLNEGRFPLIWRNHILLLAAGRYVVWFPENNER